MSGLPIEGWIGFACGVLFFAVLIWGICTSSREADEVDQEIFDAECEARRLRPSYFDDRAERLGSEAEAFLQRTVR